MNKGALRYEGKAKKVYATDQKNQFLVEFKDDATAFNGKKKGCLAGKGRLNNAISARLLSHLERCGVATHFVEKVSATEQLVRAVEIIPLEVVVRNIACGSLVQRLGLSPDQRLQPPVVEFYYKNDQLGDPLVNEAHIRLLQVAEPLQVTEMEQSARMINYELQRFFATRGITLVDLKLEFGTDEAGRLLLADEISPDTCRLWDTQSKKKLDKDRFRQDLGEEVRAYQEVWDRIEKE